MSDKILPFGKHKGERICDCPILYLDWLIGQDWFIVKFEDLAAEVEEFLEGEPEWQRLRE
ncbi:MAG: hypothetical protein AMJ65_08210 [Phycisphaerae bacterium SG8_4]|nr:MAG: hypothetical protein AMJ65_08210 [Phycisphaerae bacterium SG8_4]